MSEALAPVFLLLGAVALLILLSAAATAVLGQETPDRTGWAPDPVQDRLFLTPTGRAQPAGHTRQGGVYGFLAPYGAVYPSEGIKLSAGTPVLWTLFDVQETGVPYWLGAKVRAYHGGGVDISVAGAYMSSTDPDDAAVGILQAVATVGSPTGGVTLGVGELFGNPFDMGRILTLGGDVRIDEGLKLVAESHWALDPGEREAVFALGARFLNGPATVEVGWLGRIGRWTGVEVLPFPLVSVSYSW